MTSRRVGVAAGWLAGKVRPGYAPASPIRFPDAQHTTQGITPGVREATCRLGSSPSAPDSRPLMERMDDKPLGLAHAEIQRLEARKRRVYMAVMPIGVLILLLGWITRSPSDPFALFVFPAFALLFVAFLFLLWRGALAFRRTEIAIFVSCAALVLSRLAWYFQFDGPLADPLTEMTGVHYWAVAVLVVAAVVVFDSRYGLLAGGAVILLSAAITVTGRLPDPAVGEATYPSPAYLLQVHLFLVLLLTLASAGTVLRDRIQSALAREEVLDRWAHTDMLTGLPNRRAGVPTLKRQAAEVERYERPTSLITVDIDHFKKVNDVHGHAVGDQVIAGVAHLLVDAVRDADFVARWGGEEFLIIAPGIPAEGAWQLAERCRKAIEQEPVAEVPVTATFGVAQFRRSESVDRTLARADRSLYQGKLDGRNRVVAEEASTGDPSEFERRGDPPP